MSSAQSPTGRPCCISIANSSTKSPRLRRLKDSNCPGAGLDVRARPWRCPITTCRRPTARRIADPVSAKQIQTLEDNCRDFGITLFGMNDIRQGIVHIIGPEQGFTLPGTTIVCGDSHTSTHGAFGALAFGIGTSEVEHVLATQCLVQTPAQDHGSASRRHACRRLCSAKDMILAIIGKIGTAGGTGYVIEYTGSAIRAAQHGRAHDALQYVDRSAARAPEWLLRTRRPSPISKAVRWPRREICSSRPCEPGSSSRPMRTRPTTGPSCCRPKTSLRKSAGARVPGMVTGIDQRVPDPRTITDETAQGDGTGVGIHGPHRRTCPSPISQSTRSSSAPAPMHESRIFGWPPNLAKGKHVAKTVHAMVVPGSGLVKKQAEQEGLDRIFKEAGFEWREAGCSMCLAMNADVLQPGERCASTSNRNFEGRQGAGGRTHLVSPAMAVAAAVEGHFVDIRTWK